MAKIYRYQINNTTIYFNALIYIDVNGSDLTGNGSKDKPYKTIKKAVSMVTINDTAIIINAGTYSERVNAYGNNNGAGTNCLFSTKQYKITFIGNKNKTIINTEFNKALCSVAAAGQSDCNIYDLIVNVTCSYAGDSSSNCLIAGNNTYDMNLNLYNCAFNFLPSVNQTGIYYDNVKGKVYANNCLFAMGNDSNSWTGIGNSTPIFTAVNCIFKNLYDWRSFGGGNKPPHMSLTNCIKNNNNYWNTYSTMTDGGGNIIFDVVYNVNYFPTNTTIWKNSGKSTFKNANNSISNIGPYGGLYQWDSTTPIQSIIQIPIVDSQINKSENCEFDFNIISPYTTNNILTDNSTIQSFNNNTNVIYLYNLNRNIWKNISKIEML